MVALALQNDEWAMSDSGDIWYANGHPSFLQGKANSGPSLVADIGAMSVRTVIILHQPVAFADHWRPTKLWYS